MKLRDIIDREQAALANDYSEALYAWADLADRALVFANAGAKGLLYAWLQCPPYLDEPTDCLAYVATHAPRSPGFCTRSYQEE